VGNGCCEAVNDLFEAVEVLNEELQCYEHEQEAKKMRP
jgi:hypothetical protein